MIPANAELQVLGNSFPDNSQAPNSISQEPLIITNYVQQMRTAVELGKRAVAYENYGGDEWPRDAATPSRAGDRDRTGHRASLSGADRAG